MFKFPGSVTHEIIAYVCESGKILVVQGYFVDLFFAIKNEMTTLNWVKFDLISHFKISN